MEQSARSRRVAGLPACYRYINIENEQRKRRRSIERRVAHWIQGSRVRQRAVREAAVDSNERAPEARVDDGFEAEISDLRPLAGGGWGWPFALWSAGGLAGKPLSPGQRLVRAATAVMVVFVAAAVVVIAGPQPYGGARATERGTVPDRPALRLQQDGLGCLSDAAWSPSGRRLAMIGVERDCQQNGPSDYIITLYDAGSGKAISRLRPDAAVLAALSTVQPQASAQGDGGPGSPVLYYSSLLWSRDERRLALPFYLQLAPRNGALQFEGLLVLYTDGTRPHVLLHETTGELGAIEWDLTAGKPLSAVAGRRSTLPFESVTPAESYSWGWGGTLVPDTVLVSAEVPAATTGPIGAPSGGTAFTLWQPGGVARQTETDGGQTYHIYTWGVTFAAWSPDGRYLVDEISQIERLAPQDEPAPSARALAAVGAADMPLLPVRDAGLRQVLLRLTHDTPGPGPQIAWRPDGRVLAVYGIGPDVTIYDCATGRVLAALAPGTTPNGAPATGSFNLLRWSPDGSHLLFVGPSLNTLSIWGPGQLPA